MTIPQEFTSNRVLKLIRSLKQRMNLEDKIYLSRLLRQSTNREKNVHDGRWKIIRDRQKRPNQERPVFLAGVETIRGTIS